MKTEGNKTSRSRWIRAHWQEIVILVLLVLFIFREIDIYSKFGTAY